MNAEVDANLVTPITEDDLEQTWKDLQQESGEEEVSRADNVLSIPREGWIPFKSDKIWVKNGRKEDLIAYIHRFNTIAELTKIGGTLGANATGAQIEAHLEVQRRAALVQIERLSAGGKKVMFDLGAGGVAAYVTAALFTNRGLLVSKDRIVRSGHCLTLLQEPWPAPDLDPGAAVVAAAATSAPAAGASAEGAA